MQTVRIDAALNSRMSSCFKWCFWLDFRDPVRCSSCAPCAQTSYLTAVLRGPGLTTPLSLLRTFYENLCIVFGVLVCSCWSVVVEFGTVDSASLRGFVPLGWKPTEEEQNIIDSDRFRTLNIPRAAMCGSMWLDIASWECWEVEFWNRSTLHSSAGSKQMASDGQSCFFQCVRAPKGMCSHISHGTWFALLAAEFLGSKIKMVAVNIKRLLLRFLQPISIMFLYNRTIPNGLS